MKKYLIIFLILFIFFGGGVVFADEGKEISNISLDPNAVWNNISGFFSNIWQKKMDIWQNDAKPWLNGLWLKFKSFFEEKRIKEEFQKETSEMSHNLAEAGNYISNKINTLKK